MEKDINTEVSNTQLPATEEKANLKESLRIQKSQWIKEQIKRQREPEVQSGVSGEDQYSDLRDERHYRG